jgi:hypothetical protein
MRDFDAEGFVTGFAVVAAVTIAGSFAIAHNRLVNAEREAPRTRARARAAIRRAEIFLADLDADADLSLALVATRQEQGQ